MPKLNYIYKRPGSRYWQYTFNVKGKRYKGSTQLENKAQAAQWVTSKRTQIINELAGILPFVIPPTLREFSADFLEHIELQHSEKPNTVKFYQQKLGSLLKFASLNSARLDHVDEAWIDRFKGKRRLEVAHSTCNRELATLSVLLNLAYERKLIQRVPKIRKFREGPGRQAVLDRFHESALIATCGQPLRDLVILILDTALRPGEALSLRWEDVELGLGGSRVHVRKGKTRNAERTVELTSRAAKALRRRADESGSNWVFPGRTPDQPLLVTSADHLFRKTCERFTEESGEPILSREIVLHSLRHTCLTRVAEAGATAFEIMKLAGHANIMTSQRYVHPNDESVRRAIAKLDQQNRTFENAESEGDSPHSLPQRFAKAA